MKDNKIEGKYKEFTYEITESGWTFFHRHFKQCHVYDVTYSFMYNPKTKYWKKRGFDMNNKEHIKEVRKRIYKSMEQCLKNKWWKDLDKKYTKQ